MVQLHYTHITHIYHNATRYCNCTTYSTLGVTFKVTQPCKTIVDTRLLIGDQHFYSPHWNASLKRLLGRWKSKLKSIPQVRELLGMSSSIPRRWHETYTVFHCWGVIFVPDDQVLRSVIALCGLMVWWDLIWTNMTEGGSFWVRSSLTKPLNHRGGGVKAHLTVLT